MLNFRALRTPPHDGAVLIEPAAGSLRKLPNDNISCFAGWSGTIGGVDWATLRGRARAAIGADPQTPIIMTGHQPEFIHPGVWAKSVMAQRLAQALGGCAVNLVVDNDVPKALSVAVPVVRGEGVELSHVLLAERGAGRPYEFLPRLDGAAVGRVRDEVTRRMGPAYEICAMPAYLQKC